MITKRFIMRPTTETGEIDRETRNKLVFETWAVDPDDDPNEPDTYRTVNVFGPTHRTFFDKLYNEQDAASIAESYADEGWVVDTEWPDACDRTIVVIEN